MGGLSFSKLLNLLEMVGCEHLKLKTYYEPKTKEGIAICPDCNGMFKVYRDRDVDDFPLFY